MPGLTEPNQGGKREDLADIYAIVDVKATPFTSMVNKSSKPTNARFSWMVDNYATPKQTGTVDGSDVSSYENHAENRAELENYIQIFRRSARVSRLAENVSTVAGVKSETGLAAAKKLVEVKRDMESTFLGGNDGQADNGSASYLTIGLDKWIDTTGPTVPASVPSEYRPASAQIETTAAADLTETKVQNVLASIFDYTGMVGSYTLFAGSVLRRAFTDFTRIRDNAASTDIQYVIRSFNVNQGDKKISSTTTIYEGDYGIVNIVSTNFIGMSGSTVDTDRGYLLDMDKIHLRSNKKPSVERFADEGGGPRLLVEAVAGLQVDNPIGLGKFKP